MTFLTFDMYLAAPLTHSHSSEEDVDRVTGPQGVSTNNVDILLRGPAWGRTGHGGPRLVGVHSLVGKWGF